jgi:PII-like signaling protein
LASLSTSALFPPETFGQDSGLELALYFDTARRIGKRSLDDALLDECDRRCVRVAELLPVVEAFGRSRRVRNERSDADPPLVLVTVDSSAAIASAVEVITATVPDVFATVAPVRLISPASDVLDEFATAPVQLAIHCRQGRHRHDPHGIGAVLESLRRSGVAGATALHAREGTVFGDRPRGGLFSSSSERAPTMVSSIDEADVLARAAPSLLALPQVELLTAKAIDICKSRGRRRPLPDATPDGSWWSRLTLYAHEDAVASWRPDRRSLLARLRKAGAPGATMLRGSLGYALDDPLAPTGHWFAFGEAPVIATIVDRCDRIGPWLELIDDVTGDDGLVTHERVWIVRGAGAR